MPVYYSEAYKNYRLHCFLKFFIIYNCLLYHYFLLLIAITVLLGSNKSLVTAEVIFLTENSPQPKQNR